MEIKDSWLPTADNINKLPNPVRKYIHDLITNSDPAGMVAENTLLRDQTKMLDRCIAQLKREIEGSDDNFTGIGFG